jgi:hypothetical protein
MKIFPKSLFDDIDLFDTIDKIFDISELPPQLTHVIMKINNIIYKVPVVLYDNFEQSIEVDYFDDGVYCDKVKKVIKEIEVWEEV